MLEKKISERAQKVLDLLCLLNPCHPGLELGSRIPGQARDDKHQDDEATPPVAPRHDDNVLPMSLSDIRLDEPAQVVRDKNEIEALLAKHGAEWQRRHPYFGTGDKPTLRRWVFNMGLYGKPFRLREGKNCDAILITSHCSHRSDT